MATNETAQVGGDAEDFVPLPQAHFHVLVALTEGDKHGYAVMQDVESLSEGAVRMGPGTLYGTLKRLLEDALVEELANRPEEATDNRRRYYRITALGERVVAAEARRLSQLARFAQAHLRPGLV